MTDQSTGTLREDVLNEIILSAIVEIKTTIREVPAVVETIERISKEIDTVVAVGISTRCEADGEERTLAPLLDEMGYTYHRAKTNLGLGRITNIQKKQEAAVDQHAASVR
jgi:hypothetical protein